MFIMELNVSEIDNLNRKKRRVTFEYEGENDHLVEIVEFNENSKPAPIPHQKYNPNLESIGRMQTINPRAASPKPVNNQKTGLLQRSGSPVIARGSCFCSCCCY